MRIDEASTGHTTSAVPQSSQLSQGTAQALPVSGVASQSGPRVDVMTESMALAFCDSPPPVAVTLLSDGSQSMTYEAALKAGWQFPTLTAIMFAFGQHILCPLSYCCLLGPSMFPMMHLRSPSPQIPTHRQQRVWASLAFRSPSRPIRHRVSLKQACLQM